MASNVVASGGKKKFSERAKGFFLGTWSELKKVHWPTKKQIVTYTVVVLVSVVIMAIVLWVMDTIFSFGIGGLMNLVK